MKINELSHDMMQCWPLMDFISRLDELEWRRFSSRYTLDENNQHVLVQHEIPSISFRFKKDDPKLLKWLADTIEDFHGTMKWCIGEHKRIGLPGINRSIHPIRSSEIAIKAENASLSVSEYLLKFEPDFTDLAFDDAISLAEFFEEKWKITNKSLRNSGGQIRGQYT